MPSRNDEEITFSEKGSYSKCANNEIYKGTHMTINTSATKDFIIRPNPSAGTFSLSLSECRENNFIAYIFTLNGNLIYESSIHLPKGGYSQLIDLHELPDGKYFIFLRGKLDFYTQKLVISRQAVGHTF